MTFRNTSQRLKTELQRDIFECSALNTTDKIIETNLCLLMSKWIKKMESIQEIGYYPAFMEGNLNIVDNMDSAGSHYGKRNESEFLRQTPNDVTYFESQIVKDNLRK